MRDKKAFTLVELAIVLIIISFLVVAAMSGGELLKVSKLQSAISEIESYKIAIDNFKTQYEALPGDIKNATSFWAGAPIGNGNGQIGTNVISDATEPIYAWNHLALSKFIPGTYTGSGASLVLGTNAPASKYIEGAGIMILYSSAPWSYVDALSRSFPSNYIALGKNTACCNLPESALKPTDAHYIDSKFDDGTPDFGKILAGSGTTGTCTTGVAPNIIYATTAAVSCRMMISIE